MSDKTNNNELRSTKRRQPSPAAEHHALSIIYHEVKESYFALQYISSNNNGFAEKRTEELFKDITNLFNKLDELPKKIKDFAVDLDD